ncbi:hypothetical protein NPIL_299011 [Nephila pilipes]|uniref:Uncharacterized protein n=1 Tax=Nephila pilipes TaxID=299642 RepID=A0A8X6MNK5_NEPPI|nr:hypothetical protein NPIL_299011 [Nephila pilipes]
MDRHFNYLDEFIFVYAFYQDPRMPGPRGRRGGIPWFDRIQCVRRLIPTALTHLYQIPAPNLILFNFYDPHPEVLCIWDIVEGMTLRLENVGVTIDRENVHF